jgi:preprotein translocase subunit SecE
VVSKTIDVGSIPTARALIYSKIMNKVIQFFKESRTEMLENVTWTKYSELQNHSILVLIASLIFAIFIGLIDFALDNGLKFFYESFK